MHRKTPFFDGNNREWHFLGVTLHPGEAVNFFKRFSIPVEPHNFRHLLLTGTKTFRDAIFTGAEEFPAIYHVDPDSETGDSDPNSKQTQISLHFDYKYPGKTQTGKDIKITPLNAKLYYKDDPSLLQGYDLETRLPISADVTIFRYTGNSYDSEVDVFVYYRWTGSDDGNTILRIRIDQEPIPTVPDGAPSVPWRELGLTRMFLNLTRDELWFWDEKGGEYHVNEFLRSFCGELWVRIIEGYGVRTANVYTPNKVLRGLQVKKVEPMIEMVQDIVGEEEYVSLSFGKELLEFNPEFMKNFVRVWYRWRSSTALELRILKDDNNQSSSLGKRKLEQEERIDDIPAVIQVPFGSF